ncbi:MAG: hypothetical protein HWQ41_24740 [Nostoc sp. NOS(2021)]|uniref:hypothetical protein n=1 Tax=Nostoc sp. NOS(2021) TaxID=2815407 RepID=UPI0025EF4808|nr:hypothetical protein [Nostoc sp. NOS(2021)]MBN3898362.1 hypothetical protein [Nostoc sp. NOS(2021)]
MQIRCVLAYLALGRIVVYFTNLKSAVNKNPEVINDCTHNLIQFSSQQIILDFPHKGQGIKPLVH